VISHFQFPRVILVGHSLGGGVASLVASMLGPTVIAKLIMIDTLGSWPANARDTPRILAESAAFVAASSQPHETIQSAAEYRSKKNFVGLMHIDDALLLAHRGTVPAPQRGPQAVVWNYDPFLKRASPLRMTPEQALACVDQLRVPTLVLLARDGLFKSIFTPFGKILTSLGK
jgi:pimeloyl-ACP methyl ester carboxylesterase